MNTTTFEMIGRWSSVVDRDNDLESEGRRRGGDVFSALPTALTIFSGDLDLLENDEDKWEKWFLYYKIMTLQFPICNNLASNPELPSPGREAESSHRG